MAGLKPWKRKGQANGRRGKKDGGKKEGRREERQGSGEGGEKERGMEGEVKRAGQMKG